VSIMPKGIQFACCLCREHTYLRIHYDGKNILFSIFFLLCYWEFWM
jgi:hypothetical protein